MCAIIYIDAARDVQYTYSMNDSKQTLKDKLQVTLVDAIQRRDIKKALQVSSLLKILNKGKK